MSTGADSTKLLITLLLWFFLGTFGAHRLYLGHVNTGLAMLALSIVGYVTLCVIVGFFFLAAVGVWWIVDLVLMLTGKLQPTDGSRII